MNAQILTMSASQSAGGTVRLQGALLEDTDGTPRGFYLSLEEDELPVLHYLYDVYAHIEEKLRSVQKFSKHLLHYNLHTPGFSISAGIGYRSIFSCHDPLHVSRMEGIMTSIISKALAEAGYCSADQEIQLYLSFLKTLKTEIQPPHIDFHWENITPPALFEKGPRSFKGNYKEWVPFVALFPLTTDGMIVEVWHARSKHVCPEQKEDETGFLVRIPFGKILLLRGDVVHAGGFAKDTSGNPRGHFYVYKSPRGVQHALPLSNCYDVAIDGKRFPLLDFYKHHPLCVKYNTVIFANTGSAKAKTNPIVYVVIDGERFPLLDFSKHHSLR
jgi:hypothetical protein